MRLTWKLALLTAAGIAVAGGCTRADTPVVPTLVVTYCESSFMNLDSARDSRSGIDLDNAKVYTLQMCSSRDEWLEIAANHPLALDGADPTVLLQEVCHDAEDPVAYPACREAAGSSDS
ncbi:MAG TPA: hypothetical protein VGC37_00610 [Friedmanniella sp.]